MQGISIKDLKVSYRDKTVFDGFCMDIKAGRVTVILGGSGVGKTTLLNVIAGLKEYEGSVSGTDGGISYIFQKDRLIPSISVYKNLDLVIKSVIRDKKRRAAMIDEMLDILEISDQKNKLPDELSGGQAQRVSMARAFLYPSDILLLDEPFRALDTALKTKLIGELDRLQSRSGRTVIFVTHAIDECLLAADDYFVFGGNPVGIEAVGSIDLKKSERKLNDPLINEERLKVLQALCQIT